MNRIVFVSIIFVFSCFSLFAQQKNNPTYYLDSVKVDINKHFINPQNIETMFVKKETTNGEVYINSKNKLELLHLYDVLKKHIDIDGLNNNLVLKINNKFINDTVDIKIDRTFFIYVQNERLIDVNYIDEKFKNLIIVNVDLESKERKPQIYLRGNQETEHQKRKEQLEE